MESNDTRFEKSLSGWKMAYLFKGGRFMWMKRGLPNLLICFLYLFPTPLSVAKGLESIQKSFFGEG